MGATCPDGAQFLPLAEGSVWEEVEVFNSDTSEYRRVYRIVSCPPGYALARDEERPNNDNCKVACPRYIAMMHSCTHQE
jgi:hypothetical protein